MSFSSRALSLTKIRFKVEAHANLYIAKPVAIPLISRYQIITLYERSRGNKKTPRHDDTSLSSRRDLFSSRKEGGGRRRATLSRGRRPSLMINRRVDIKIDTARIQSPAIWRAAKFRSREPHGRWGASTQASSGSGWK